MAVLWKAYFEVYPWGVVLRVPPPMVAGHTSMGSAYAFATTVCPFYTDAAGGCCYCHTAPWKRAMRRLAHGLTRSRGARGLACDVTWPDVRLHPIRLNRAFRSDLMWWRTFVEDWNGISFLPPPTAADGFRRIGVMGLWRLARLQLVSAPVG